MTKILQFEDFGPIQENTAVDYAKTHPLVGPKINETPKDTARRGKLSCWNLLPTTEVVICQESS